MFRASSLEFRISGEAGFTLVEVLVVFSFAMAITSLVLVGYRRLTTSGALQRASQKVVQDIRRAQAYAINTDPTRFSGSTPPCGYGLHWPDPATADPNSYLLYARQVRSGIDPLVVNCVTEPYYYGGLTASTEAVAVNAYVLPESGNVSFLNALQPGDLSTTDVYFLPPDPQAFLVDNATGALYNCGLSICSVTATVVLTSDPSQKKSILVYDSGRMEIQ